VSVTLYKKNRMESWPIRAMERAGETDATFLRNLHISFSHLFHKPPEHNSDIADGSRKKTHLTQNIPTDSLVGTTGKGRDTLISETSRLALGPSGAARILAPGASVHKSSPKQKS
jgi:hypothetical protein